MELLQKVRDKQVRLAVIGLGRIGLPTAIFFATRGFSTAGIDVNPALVEQLNRGENPLTDEQGLTELLGEALASGRFHAYTRFADGLAGSDVILLCVPTPVTAQKVPDYSIISRVAHDVARQLRPGHVVVIESSVSPSTSERVVPGILEAESGLVLNADFGVVSCPERANPGEILANLDALPRIIGGSAPAYTRVVAELYSLALDTPIVTVSSPGTANAVKLTENIFRDLNIAFVNELAILFEELGINVMEVLEACESKYNFVRHDPGAGVGGPCLPANAYYLIHDTTDTKFVPYLVRIAREVNDRMPHHVFDLVLRLFNRAGTLLNGHKVTVLGVAYKPDVADLQISPALKVIALLQQGGARVAIYDPYFVGQEVQGVRVSENLEAAARDSEALVFLAAHAAFHHLDFPRLAALMNAPFKIVDGRNFVPPEALPAGTYYCGIGIPLRVVGAKEGWGEREEFGGSGDRKERQDGTGKG